MKEFFVGYDSDRGAVHKINQDSIFLKSLSDGKHTALVVGLFDGMGGYLEGERASGAAAQAFSAWADKNRPLILAGKFPEAVDSLRAEFDLMNSRIRFYGERSGIEVGTTAAILLIGGGTYVSGNIGDSRIYHIERERISQLTEDHSFLAELVRAGLLEEDRVKTHPNKNVLTQALGVLEKITPFFRSGTYKRNDVFLLCSDGFYNKANDAELLKLYAVDEDTTLIAAHLRQIRTLVISRGETDNITGIMIKVASEG